ncbi:MAG TPA: cache domain-containing protein [Polyangiaceae bacterium]|nr:cache domain-containing protein [Polyangiaceae bacterium]
MTLKAKLVSLFFLTLVVALGAVAVELVQQATRLGEHQRQLLEDSMLAQKKAELVRAVAFLKSELVATFPSESKPDPERVKAIIAAANAGEDGYFFLYDLEGHCLVHPRQPELVGQNLQSLTDAHGRRVIPSLIETAQAGGGFQRYSWLKPSSGRTIEKLGYVALLEPWRWVLGTGVYLDDVEQATEVARASSEASIRGTLWRLAGVALLALLAVFLGGVMLTVTEQRIADRSLRAMSERVVYAQENERAVVARNLHDGIVQMLVSARFFIEAGRERLAGNPRTADEMFEKSLRRLDETIADVRGIAHGLLPATLRLGLGPALRELGEEAGARLSIRVVTSDGLGSQPLGDKQALALFRTAQEAIVNIERYAQASEVTIELELVERGRRARLRVIDNGRGFDPRARHSGSGLGNMRHRVQDLGGTFAVESRPGRTEIRAELEVEP